MAKQREAPAEREAAPSPRSFWSGTLTFGLVSVPVDLFPQTFHFETVVDLQCEGARCSSR